ncbi:DUF4149 domain-containing protein [Tropicimonas sp. S265A]|uniref:DUF4149 domain-containing protein n=1 Tax=Tropicimonas sp. S265A TaxID=3415134 RepID=UPI003C7A9F36
MESAALLATATLFGGMTLYSFGFAPLLFAELRAEAAGRLLRRAFPWYYLFIIAVSALGAGLLWPLDRLSVGLMIGTAAIALVARQGLMPRINSARDAFTAGDATAKRKFDMLHGLSVALNMVQLGLVAWVLIRFL